MTFHRLGTASRCLVQRTVFPGRSFQARNACFIVPRDGIEPPTRGFSIPRFQHRSAGKARSGALAFHQLGTGHRTALPFTTHVPSMIGTACRCTTPLRSR